MMNFRNLKEFITQNGPNNINHFHFLHRCHILRYLKDPLHPIFLVSLFPVLDMFFGCRSRRDGDKFPKAEGGFSPRRSHVKQPPPIL
jgi:hypothetical protein